MKKSRDETAIESPIPFHTGSNGEYSPPAQTKRDIQANELFHKLAAQKAKRLGMSRREFVISKLGTVTALMVLNQAYGCSYEVDEEMTEDSQAWGRIDSKPFVFDVQTHHVNPKGTWRDPALDRNFLAFPQSGCGEADFIDCLDVEHYIHELFVNSQTDLAVLSAIPARPGTSPLENEEHRITRELVNRLYGTERLITHGMVHPDLGEDQLDGMQALVEVHKIAAWKVYTQLGAYRLDDPSTGIRFIEKARELDVKIICAHKGFPIFELGREYAAADDIGIVAAAYPDVSFLVYHSGFEAETHEGPYDPMSERGVDTLITAVLKNGLAGKKSNVYAELGSTWRFLMTRPIEAAHVIGKLLLYLGEDHILWGTDSIWYGSPQDQIDAFMAFQIPVEMQELYGYPALTKQVRNKIFGRNAARVYGIKIHNRKLAIAEDEIAHVRRVVEADPSLRKMGTRVVGPRTRNEFMQYVRDHEFRPL